MCNKWCEKCVIRVQQKCNKCVKLVSQKCYKGVPNAKKGCKKCVTREGACKLLKIIKKMVVKEDKELIHRKTNFYFSICIYKK